MISTDIIRNTFIHHPPQGMSSAQAAEFFQQWLEAQHNGEWIPGELSAQAATPVIIALRDTAGNASRQARINTSLGMLTSVIETLKPLAETDERIRQSVHAATQAKLAITNTNPLEETA